MSLLPAPVRHRTIFDALSDLATYQHENQQLLSQLVTAHTAAATDQTILIKTLSDGQAKLTAAVATMTAVQQKAADTPTTITVQGTVATEVQQHVCLAETQRLSPMALLAVLAPLHEIEKRLADVRIAEKPGREAALGHYATALRDLEDRLGADTHLKALKPRVKALVLKPVAETREAIERETLEKLSLLHALAASAVALHAAAHNPQNG